MWTTPQSFHLALPARLYALSTAARTTGTDTLLSEARPLWARGSKQHLRSVRLIDARRGPASDVLVGPPPTPLVAGRTLQRQSGQTPSTIKRGSVPGPELRHQLRPVSFQIHRPLDARRG